MRGRAGSSETIPAESRRWGFVAVCALVFTVGAAPVWSEPSESNGPFVQSQDAAREDYYDQFDHAVPVERIINQAKDAFAERYADAFIDRDAQPNLLRIYVLDANNEDQALLERIAGGNPQVVLASSSVTWDELLRAKSAVADVAEGKSGLDVTIIPDITAQGLVVEGERVPEEVKEEIADAAPGVPVNFRANTAAGENELFHSCRTCYPHTRRARRSTPT